ncbi:hypothetical protein BGZ47_009641 [Haplosporangium gracile]|nr:hypothetical protein BGZ47_009641 [Haplosporangium gracile]
MEKETRIANAVKVFSKFGCLHKLKQTVSSVAQLEYLGSLHEIFGANDPTLFLDPSVGVDNADQRKSIVEELDIRFCTLNPIKVSVVLKSLTCAVRTSPLMATLKVKDLKMDPMSLFDRTWACKGLTTLDIVLKETDQVEKATKDTIWYPIHVQFGLLGQLQRLTIHCSEYVTSSQSGFHQFLCGMKSLRSLCIEAKQEHVWTRKDIDLLLVSALKLVKLALSRLPAQNFSRIYYWLERAGRRNIAFSS